MAGITLARSSDLRAPAPVAPQVRTRTRVAPAAPAPEPAPAAVAGSNSSALTAKLRDKLQVYAIHNAAKNKASSAESKAKKDLEKTLIAEGETEFSGRVTVDGNEIEFCAKIAEADETYVDPKEVLTLVGGDLDEFLKLVSINKGTLEAAHGSAAVSKCERTRKKPASLSIAKV